MLSIFIKISYNMKIIKNIIESIGEIGWRVVILFAVSITIGMIVSDMIDLYK